MRMEQLRCLVDIAQTGSLTSTAQRLYVSQQAISKSMKQLEQELGIEILIRTNIGVQITQEGQRVVEFARMVLQEEERLSADLSRAQTARPEITLLKICSTSAVTNIVLPNIINELDVRQQNVKFKISMEDRLEKIIEKVQNRECDMGLITFNADELLRRFADIESEVYLDILARDEIIALMHKRHIKSEDGRFPVLDVTQHPMTLYNIIPVDTAYDYPRDLRESYLMYSNDADFHRVMMEKNGAIVLMPALAQHYFFTSKKIVQVDIPLDTPLLHAAMYRYDADELVQEVAKMIRREMQLK